jgi:hypothetical protein
VRVVVGGLARELHVGREAVPAGAARGLRCVQVVRVGVAVPARRGFPVGHVVLQQLSGTALKVYCDDFSVSLWQSFITSLESKYQQRLGLITISEVSVSRRETIRM